MADFDFEGPSFSLGLDFDPHIISSNHVNEDHFETLIVDDSDPDYSDPHPKFNRLLRTGYNYSPI